jgi:two-component sensor histidine kinase
MISGSFIRSLLVGWLYSFLAFGLLALLLVGQFTWAASIPWTGALHIAERDWLFWAIVAPSVFQLVARMPLGRSRWKVALPVHVLCGAIILTLSNWWADTFVPKYIGSHGPEHPGIHGPAEPGHGRGGFRPMGPPPNPEHGGGQHGPPGPHGPPPRMAWNSIFQFGFRLPTYLAIVCAAHALHFYRRSQERERLEASLAKARLEALKMQLQPHFLFNSLNAITALVHKDADAAEEMLAALADLLRLTLETSGDQELPLQRELKFVESYLAIEHVRFGDRLRFQLDIDPETRGALVPNFLLQPLVENAVRHGLEPRSGEGLLTVEAKRDRETLRLAVSDNGVGLPNAAAPPEGIGLRNTRERLRELYGDKASLDLRNAKGLRVEVSLPFHLA